MGTGGGRLWFPCDLFPGPDDRMQIVMVDTDCQLDRSYNLTWKTNLWAYLGGVI